MKIAIDAPAKRSLSPTEKKVYNLLQGGNTPKEVAKITRIPYGSDNLFIFNPNISTIKTIIVSIREKGWEIPEPNNKEEIEMPKGAKISPEKAAEVKALRSEGKTIKMISEITGVAKTTAQRICSKENEPVQAATCTDSGVENIGNVSTPIISEKTEVVKRVFSESILDAAYKLICDKQNEILAYNKKLEDMYKAQDTINSRIDATNDMIMYAEQELDRLWEDYAALCGEVAE